MPTTLPITAARPVRRLSLGETVRFLFLVAEVRLLDLRLSALYGGAERRGREPHGPTLLRLVRRWLAVHERIGALLPGIPEPPHVQQVRVVLGFLTERP
ncbi:hypothetical protein [Methylobacterium sp. J-067]|uniref:hypothetical protein n=1 Tax=Methylobacterium sp. J-067 TaxID=2836648 RepID=UPI001FB9256D|nr:hypothetical protein [Methylobacterium sp. J-067]MCJ2023117.1 hypothetical protein [Methylobacterium sp. J-067]